MTPTTIALLLYLLAVTLVVVDIFVPSGGALLVLAAVSAVGCILFGYRAGDTLGMTMVTLVAASIPILAVAALRIWPHTPIGKRIVLRPPKAEIKNLKESNLEDLIGLVVKCDYPMLPSGQITIDRKRYNAMAEYGDIEAGQVVEIVGIRERNLIVRPSQKPLSVPTPQTKTTPPELPSQNLLETPAEDLGLDSLDE